MTIRDLTKHIWKRNQSKSKYSETGSTEQEWLKMLRIGIQLVWLVKHEDTMAAQYDIRIQL